MSAEQLIAQLGNLLRVGTKTNAFAPLVWLCGFVIIATLGGMLYFVDFYIRIVLLGLLVIVILFALAMYLVLFLKDPRLLQSENYRIEDKKLDIVLHKGVGQVPLNPVDLSVPTKHLEGGTHE